MMHSGIGSTSYIKYELMALGAINYELMVSTDVTLINTPSTSRNVRTVLGWDVNCESPSDLSVTLDLDLRPFLCFSVEFSRKSEI